MHSPVRVGASVGRIFHGPNSLSRWDAQKFEELTLTKFVSPSNSSSEDIRTYSTEENRLPRYYLGYNEHGKNLDEFSPKFAISLLQRWYSWGSEKIIVFRSMYYLRVIRLVAHSWSLDSSGVNAHLPLREGIRPGDWLLKPPFTCIGIIFTDTTISVYITPICNKIVWYNNIIINMILRYIQFYILSFHIISYLLFNSTSLPIWL